MTDKTICGWLAPFSLWACFVLLLSQVAQAAIPTSYPTGPGPATVTVLAAMVN